MSTHRFEIRVVIDPQVNRIQKVVKAVAVLVAVAQPCHRGEVVNTGWREAEVPSLDMASYLGSSDLRAHPVDGAVGWSPKTRGPLRSIVVGPGGVDGIGRPATLDRRLPNKHSDIHLLKDQILCGDVAVDHLGR